MYYEEKIINGILMFRNNPNGDWHQVSIENMSKRIAEFKETLITEKERAYLKGKQYEKDRIKELLVLS